MLAVTFRARARLRIMSAPRAKRRGWRAAWPWLLLGLSLVLWTFSGPTVEPLTADTPAPELALTSTAGEFDLADQEGRVVVLAFWATWCAACRAEAPVLSRVYQQISGRGDRVLGVSIDRMPLDELGGAARRIGMSYPVANATRADFDRFHVELLPTIYVIGPEGRIRAMFTGPTGEATILRAVEAAGDGQLSSM